MSETFSKEKTGAFGAQLMNAASMMYLGNLAWIGVELDLFATLAGAGADGYTVGEFAEKSNCNGRYLQEWLCAMSSAGWTEYRAEEEKWVLPAEHAFFLAKKDHASYMGGMLAAVQPLAMAAPKILECFRHGGGVSTACHHPRIGSVIDGLTGPGQTYLAAEAIKKHLSDVHERLEAGIVVADVGCGTGRCLAALAGRYPKSTFFGYEPSAESSSIARELTKELTNVTIEEATSQAMPDAHFDFIMTWDVVHDVSEPVALLQDVHRGLKDDGVYLMNEISASSNMADNLDSSHTFLYSISTMYCLTVSMAGGGPAYGACMGEEAPRRMCQEVGFASFLHLADAEPMRLYRITKM